MSELNLAEVIPIQTAPSAESLKRVYNTQLVLMNTSHLRLVTEESRPEPIERSRGEKLFVGAAVVIGLTCEFIEKVKSVSANE